MAGYPQELHAMPWHRRLCVLLLWTEAGWQSLLETKHKSPLAEGTPVLSDQDRNTLLDWLVSKFGPNDKAIPENICSSGDHAVLHRSRSHLVLNRSCVSCHSIDRVMNSRYSADEWRVIAVEMKNGGANITNEDLERLVEWLGRVKAQTRISKVATKGITRLCRNQIRQTETLKRPLAPRSVPGEFLISLNCQQFSGW